MAIWNIIRIGTIILLLLALVYLRIRLPRLLPKKIVSKWGNFRIAIAGYALSFGFMGLMLVCFNPINAIVCVFYFAMILCVCDIISFIIQRRKKIHFQRYYAGMIAIPITCFALSIGWFLDHHVFQTNYSITTDKKISHIRIAMFADSHLGTTFDSDGFAKHLEKIQAQKPDVLVVVGDYVDDGSNLIYMIEASRALGSFKAKHGVFFVFGNHDKGYYSPSPRGYTADDLVNELKKNNVTVLRDEAVLIDNSFYLIGRRDISEVNEMLGSRLSMAEIISGLDESKYMIVLDHQPVDYANQVKSEVDLVLSGHTHGGQLFPFNKVGRWIRANDMVYGHQKRNKTDFIVTSGISDWAILFKTGTKSEFVIIDVKGVSKK